MRRWLMFLGRLALGGILIYAGYVKVRLPWISFAAQIQAYKLSWLTDDAVIFIARTLPWFEIVLGAALAIGFGLRWVATVASGLLLGFFSLLLRSYILGMDIDCGCFGEGDRLTWVSLVRDGALLLGSLALTRSAFAEAGRRRREAAPSTVASSSASGSSG